MYDSKKRPHKIVIYSKFKEGMTAIDLDTRSLEDVCQMYHKVHDLAYIMNNKKV